MAKINTRIQLKYDSLEAWLGSSTILLPGEIAIAMLDNATTNNKGLVGDNSENKTPIVGIKVGDGGHTFSELQWIQAIAGDVSTFVKGITDSTSFATKVAAATGYTAAELQAAFTNITNNYATNSALSTGLNGKVDKTTYNQAVADLEAAIGEKLDTSTFTTYQGTITEALAKKVETSLVDTENAPVAGTNELVTSTTVDGKITAALEPVNTKVGTNTTNIASNLREINALKEAIGDNADGESLAGRVETLEENMNTVQAATQGYTTAGSIKTAIDDAKAAGTDAQGQIGVLSTLTTDAKTTVVAAINELQGEITKEIGDRESAVQSVSSKVETLIGSDANKSVRAIATAVLTEELIPEGAADSLNTLEEIAAWIQDHPGDAAAMNARLEELKTALGGTGAVDSGYSITPVSDQIDTKISTYNTNTIEKTYATKATVTEVSNVANAAKAKADTAVQDVTTGSSNGTISVDGTDVSVKGLGTAAYTNANAYATAAQGTAANSAVQTASFAGTEMTKSGTALTISQADARTALGLGSAAYKADTYFGTAANVSANATAISNMNGSLADGNGLIKTISQTSGKISATRRLIKPADISTDAADVFIFDCGDASRDA